MPNPINRIVTDPHVVLDTRALSDKPEMAKTVAEIVATWGSIERELSSMMVRLLGADAAPAHAMFSMLPTQSLQNRALDAAAYRRRHRRRRARRADRQWRRVFLVDHRFLAREKFDLAE